MASHQRPALLALALALVVGSSAALAAPDATFVVTRSIDAATLAIAGLTRADASCAAAFNVATTPPSTLATTLQRGAASDARPLCTGIGVFADRDAPVHRPLFVVPTHATGQLPNHAPLVLPNLRAPVHLRLLTAPCAPDEDHGDGATLPSIERAPGAPLRPLDVETAPTLVEQHGVPSDDIIVGRTSAPCFGHLALTTGGVSEMRVIWTDDGSAATPTVKWGPSATSMPHSAAADNSQTYAATDMCGAPANSTGFVDPGTMHDAVMTGLSPGDTVFYSYGDAAGSGLWSAAQSFTVGPKSSDTFTFYGFGDMGVQPGQPPAENSTAYMAKQLASVDLALDIGDISYARGHASIWDAYMSLISPVAQSIPWMTGTGNHDFDDPAQNYHPWWGTYGHDSGGECGVPMQARFHMPYPDEADTVVAAKDVSAGAFPRREHYYHSFSMGPVHFCVMDTENNFTAGSAQQAWIAKDLAAVDRTKTPWLVFAGHRPMYDSTVGGLLPEVSMLRKSIEPLLVKNKVDLALWGHIHQYQRGCRMVDSKCDDSGPVQMVVGNAGNQFQVPWLPQPKWAAYRTNLWGITTFEAVNTTHMHGSLVNDADGSVLDDFWVTRTA